MEHPALASLDAAALASDAAALVRIRSVTGQERPACEEVARQARALGLRAEVVEHDLEAVRADPRHPGEEAPRTELVGVRVTLPGSDPDAPRLAFCGHIDVVDAGTEPWARDPFSGAIEGSALHGRGSADMKGGVVAVLHALGALRAGGSPPSGDVVLLAVSSEEDGGLGAFAALREDAEYAACLIPEPTDFAVCCAQGGALTFTGTVPGVAAHAAVRTSGVSALDRYIPIHLALAAHEKRVNSDPGHPLMAELDLPYPLLVGRLEAGSWSSQVPDHLTFEGRLGVRVGQDLDEARGDFLAAVAGACPEAAIEWTGGQFSPAAIDVDHPWVARVRAAATEELGSEPPLVGVPYGADMRHFTTAGVPTVMFGAHGLERAHAVDEWIDLTELETLARVAVRVVTSGP